MSGATAPDATSDFGVVRYTSSGALDSSFGTGGKTITPMGPGTDNADYRSVVVRYLG